MQRVKGDQIPTLPLLKQNFKDLANKGLLLVVGGKKVFFPTNEIYVGLESLNRNSTMGLMHGPKAISEGPKNPLYFMPWA